MRAYEEQDHALARFVGLLDLSDGEVCYHASRGADAGEFVRLVRGALSEGERKSEADLKLATIFARYTQDRPQLYRLMRRSGLGVGAQGPWADREDHGYRRRVIDQALENARRGVSR